jgi:peptidoglycan/xylan/chitin deacetylase (PgdA/CDA1 family)
MFSIPIFMLHYVGDYLDPSGKLMAITPQKFDTLLDIIEKEGYHTITFEELAKGNVGQKRLEKAVIITFDDGAKDLFEYAIPHLLKRKMKACFFVPTANIGTYNNWDHDTFGAAKISLMNEHELLELRDLGMEVGSHAHQHLHLDTLSEVECLKQMQTSKQRLEKLLQKTIYTFSWPYGNVPKHYHKMMQKAGYKFGLCIYRPFQNEYTLRRIGIHENDTTISIQKKLTKKYLWLRAFLDIWLSIKPSKS